MLIFISLRYRFSETYPTMVFGRQRKAASKSPYRNESLSPSEANCERSQRYEQDRDHVLSGYGYDYSDAAYYPRRSPSASRDFNPRVRDI